MYFLFDNKIFQYLYIHSLLKKAYTIVIVALYRDVFCFCDSISPEGVSEGMNTTLKAEYESQKQAEFQNVHCHELSNAADCALESSTQVGPNYACSDDR